jgi:hypothetical protein
MSANEEVDELDPDSEAATLDDLTDETGPEDTQERGSEDAQERGSEGGLEPAATPASRQRPPLRSWAATHKAPTERPAPAGKAAAGKAATTGAPVRKAATERPARATAPKSSSALSSPGAAGERRGPGRPPSKPRAPPLERKGIVDSPDDSANRLEFAYSEPMVFKALFTYFKNIKAREIHLRCRREGLTFFARDHTKTSRVVAFVAGHHVNWHYCEDEYWLGINRANVEKMFAAIDKTFFKITIMQTHEDTKSLTFVFKDAEVDKECNYRVTLSSYAKDIDLYEAEKILAPESLESLFPVQFTLTAKQFKKSISDANNYSETITFEKLGKEPLQFTYTKQNVAYHEVYRSPDKIHLLSKVTADTAFRSTVAIANVKSLAASMVTDDVRILCRESGDILFRSAFDAKALVVSTLTKSS